MDTLDQAEALAEKLDLIRDFCVSNLLTRSDIIDYEKGYEDACEHIFKIVSE